MSLIFNNEEITNVFFNNKPVFKIIRNKQTEWEKSGNAIIFELNGGSGVDYIIQAPGTIVAAPIPPTRIGYTFVGWFSNSSLTQSYTFATMPTGCVTVYAKWQLVEYKITYKLENGVNNPLNPSKYTIEFPDIIFAEPTRLGHNFLWWDYEQIPTGYFSDIEVRACWKAIDYIVSFDSYGGSDVANKIVAYEQAYGMLPTPTRASCIFNGWHTSRGDKVEESTIYTSLENQTLHAYWVAGKYTVYFDTQGESFIASRDIKYGEKYDILPTLERTGYEFVGWYTSEGTKIEADMPYETAGDQTLFAKWRFIYTVTYEVNGGSMTAKTKGIGFGASYTLDIPTRTGYTFDGWFSAETGTKYTNSLGHSLEIWGDTSNITLYAKWAANIYTLYFDYQFESGLSFKGVTYQQAYGDLLSLTRTGYQLEGWYTSKDNKIESNRIKSNTIYETVGDQILYAKWTANEYILYFDHQGGEGPSFGYVKYDEAYNLKSSNRTGYVFVGWYTSEGTKIESNMICKMLEDQTLYARWERNYIVNYNVNGGSMTETNKVVAYGEKYRLDIPSRTGYAFTGWYDATTGGKPYTYSSGNSLEIWGDSSDITLYAQWTANEYILYFDHQGGSGLDIGAVKYEQAYGFIPPSNRKGYVFTGWYTSGGTKIEATTIYTTLGDQTLYAWWR